MRFKIGEAKEALELKALEIKNDSVKLSIKSSTGEVQEVVLWEKDYISLSLVFVKEFFK